jgi:hypothetical protein
MTQLALLGRPAAPSVVEGCFAVESWEERDARTQAERDRALVKLAGSKRVRRNVLAATRYALRRGIQRRCEWLPRSVRHCGSKRAGAQVQVARSTSGRSVWLGVNRCKDPRACPTCSAAVTAQRRDDLLLAFSTAREAGWSAMAVSLTVRHGIGHDGRKLAELVSKAYRLTFERAGMRNTLRPMGYQGCVRIVETTYSLDNGYHPHLHLVLMFDRQLTDFDRFQVEQSLFDAWVLAVNDARIRVGVDVGLPDRDHGVDVQLLDLSRGADYFVKVGLVAELLGQFSKRGRAKRSRSMWEVARDMVTNDRLGLSELADEDEAVFKGYVEAMRHFKSFFVAKRIRSKLMQPLQLELELGEDAKPAAVVVYSFDDREYGLVVTGGPVVQARIDDIVEDGGKSDDVAQYLAQVAELLADFEDRARCRDPVPFRVFEPHIQAHQLGDRMSIYGADLSILCARSARMLDEGVEKIDTLLDAA